MRPSMFALIMCCILTGQSANAAPHVHDGHCIALAMHLVAIVSEIDQIESSVTYEQAVERREDLKRIYDKAHDDYLDALVHDFTDQAKLALLDAEIAAYNAWREAANADVFCDVEELEDEFRRTLVLLFQICPLS